MTDSSSTRPTPRPTRAGYVALAGRPNTGKSTLLNALLGEKLSIVTPKPQTTWRRVTGIHTSSSAQMILLDTPGLFEAAGLLQQAMLESTLTALSEADVVLLVLDAGEAVADGDVEAIEEALALSDAPRIVVLNKIDTVPGTLLSRRRQWTEDRFGARAFLISARNGTDIEALRSAIVLALPAGPFLYPEDELASAPVRFFVAELVRETVFERYRQEVPYSVICQVEEFREDQSPAYIGVNIFVERQSQKGIVIGKGGAGIRELGRAARLKVEHFLGRPVYLQLRVKTLAGWRRRHGDLRRLGFRLAERPPENR